MKSYVTNLIIYNKLRALPLYFPTKTGSFQIMVTLHILTEAFNF